MEYVRKFVKEHEASVDCTYSFQLQAVSDPEEQSESESYRIDFNDSPPYPCSLAELMAAIPGAEYRGEGIVPTRLTPGGTFHSYSSQEGVIHYGDNIECTLSGNGHLLVTVTNARGPEGYIGFDPYTGAHGSVDGDFLQALDVCTCLANILTHLRSLYNFKQNFQFAMGYMEKPSLSQFSEIIIKNERPQPIVPVVVHVRNMKLLKEDKTAEKMRQILKSSQRVDRGDSAFGYLRGGSKNQRVRRAIVYKESKPLTNRKISEVLFYTYWARVRQHVNTEDKNCQLAKVDIRLKFGNRPSTQKTMRPTIELFMAHNQRTDFQGLRGEESELVGRPKAVYLLQHGSDPFLVNLFRTLEAEADQFLSNDKKLNAATAEAAAKAAAAAAAATEAAKAEAAKAAAEAAAAKADGERILETVRRYLQALHDQKSKSRFDEAFMFTKAVIWLAEQPSANTLFGNEWYKSAEQKYKVIEKALEAIGRVPSDYKDGVWPDAKPVNMQRVKPQNKPEETTQVFLDIKVEATHIVRGRSTSQKRVQADLGRITTTRVGVFAKLLQNAKKRLNQEESEWKEEKKKKEEGEVSSEVRDEWTDPDPPVPAFARYVGRV